VPEFRGHAGRACCYDPARATGKRPRRAMFLDRLTFLTSKSVDNRVQSWSATRKHRSRSRLAKLPECLGQGIVESIGRSQLRRARIHAERTFPDLPARYPALAPPIANLTGIAHGASPTVSVHGLANRQHVWAAAQPAARRANRRIIRSRPTDVPSSFPLPITWPASSVARPPSLSAASPSLRRPSRRCRWSMEFPSSVEGDQLKSLFNSALRASFPARLAAAVVSK
jgi:hypothetical protein